MPTTLRDRLRAAADLALRTGRGSEFVTTARQELAAAVVEIGEAVAVNADVAASAAGLSARSLRRHLAERRTALRDEAHESVDGEPNEQAMLELRSLARKADGRVTEAQVLAVAKRRFPGSSRRHTFMRDVWLDHGWLLTDVRGGYRVADVTSAYRMGPDRQVMADVSRQVQRLLDGGPSEPRDLADRRVRLTISVDANAGGLALADDLRAAVIRQLTQYENAHADSPSSQPARSLKVALVAAFDGPPADDDGLVVWAEARVTVEGTREMISVLTTDPISEPDASRVTAVLAEQAREVLAHHHPGEGRPAVHGELMVVTCFV